VDDGSSDDTKRVAYEWIERDGRFRYYHKENGGLSSARNLGLSHAVGEYIQFLDADDILRPYKFEHQVNLLNVMSEVGIVYGNAWYFSGDSSETTSRGPYADHPDHDWIAEAWNDCRPMVIKLVERNIFPVCSPLLRKSVCDKVGCFDEELEALEDWEYWTRCAINYVEFFFSDRCNTEACIRMHGESMTNDQGRIQRAYLLFRMVCHEKLPAGEARIINLEHLLSLFLQLSREDYVAVYDNTFKVCRSRQERFIVKFCEFCDAINHQSNSMLAKAGQRIIWPLRGAFVSMWLNCLKCRYKLTV